MNEEKEFQKTLYYFRLGKNSLSELDFASQKEKVSSFIKRQCNSENLHFFLGSGCSLPAVPLMGYTFTELKNEELDQSTLGKFGGNNKDIEGYLNWLKNAIIFYGEDSAEGQKFKESFNKTKAALLKSMPSDYISNATNQKVVTTFINYQSFYSAIFLQREFKKLSPINIFTTNYDLFNEVSLENIGIHYTNGFRGSVNSVFDPSIYRLRLVDDENRYKEKWSTVRQYVKLYKIHGSIDWKYSKHLKAIVQTNSSHESTEDIMIYPTINKHLETQQSPYSELLREFTISLQKKNSTMVIIGYGFPDEHINQLISQALNNEDFNLIVFGNKNEPAALQFFNQHKSKPNFHFIGGSIRTEADGHHFNNVIQYLGIGDKNVQSE